MLNFFKKPLGYVLIVLAHGIIANQVYALFFPHQTQVPQFTLAMGVWCLVSLYVFLTTFLLYRLLIKQEPFSKEFKKKASKYYAVIMCMYVACNFLGSKILYGLNPDLAQKLLAKNTLDFVNYFGWPSMLVVLPVFLLIAFPASYWINYGYLWLTDKIVNCFLKSNEA